MNQIMSNTTWMHAKHSMDMVLVWGSPLEVVTVLLTVTGLDLHLTRHMQRNLDLPSGSRGQRDTGGLGGHVRCSCLQQPEPGTGGLYCLTDGVVLIFSSEPCAGGISLFMHADRRGEDKKHVGIQGCQSNVICDESHKATSRDGDACVPIWWFVGQNTCRHRG